MKIQSFKLNEEGLNHFFGPLEAKIMNIMWNASEITIKEVQELLDKDKPLNFNTVMTVMNRLVEKGYLQKRSKGRGSVFQATQSKEDFLQTQTKKMTEELLGEYGDLVVNHMIDALEEANPELLEKLEAKLNQIKKGKKY